jgi:hypothetical protein
MPSYTHRKRDFELSRLSYPMKAPDDGAGSGAESRKTAVRASEVDAVISIEPTLDDFGGRSDALGG